jgi:hypothetical protein
LLPSPYQLKLSSPFFESLCDRVCPYVVLTTWKDQQAFQDWVGSEDFKVAHQNPLAINRLLRTSDLSPI